MGWVGGISINSTVHVLTTAAILSQTREVGGWVGWVVLVLIVLDMYLQLLLFSCKPERLVLEEIEQSQPHLYR